ncbi:MAG: 3-deoxy-D-manno-octulosonic acid transferase [Planctomycetota bacterium]
MRWVADLLYLLAGLTYLPVALYQVLIVGKNRRGWSERFGFLRLPRPEKPRIWIHAVSLGEMNATPKLVEALHALRPNVEFVFSTTTDTGFARGAQRYGPKRVFRFPLDFSLIISRVLRHIRPSMIVLVELEVWYNLTRLAARRGIPVVVVNGRMTKRSARRLHWLGPPGRAMFADLAWVGAQDETIAARFREAGVTPDRVEVTSSMKWDTAQLAERVSGDAELAAALGIDAPRPLWVCGSTGDGEEEIILQAYRTLVRSSRDAAQGVPSGQMAIDNVRQNRERERENQRHGRLSIDDCRWGAELTEQERRVRADDSEANRTPLLCIVPRKPERFDEVARSIENAGYACVRRSRCPDGSPTHPSLDNAVILGDTMGELRKFYSLASVIFVGRSLVNMGGSDPMEAAALGKALIVGPHMENFEAAVHALHGAEAVRVVRSADDLAASVRRLLADSTSASNMGRRAREVVSKNQGATRRTASRIVQMLAQDAGPEGLPGKRE